MIRTAFSVISSVISDFFGDRVPQFAAALSFYAAFSMAPLIVMMLTALALILDGSAAREFVLSQISTDLGPQVGQAVQDMLAHTDRTERRGMAALFASGAMLIGATAVLMSLKSALDHIFGGPENPSARALWVSVVLARFKAFIMVLILAVMLASSLLFAALAGGIATAVGNVLPNWVDLAGWMNAGAAICLITVLFFIVYRFFPDNPPRMGAALIGAIFAALLFTLGKRVITLYVTTVGTASAFGAAGALAVILVWIYISANIVLLGAECTKTYERFRPLTKNIQ